MGPFNLIHEILARVIAEHPIVKTIKHFEWLTRCSGCICEGAAGQCGSSAGEETIVKKVSAFHMSI
jgi:hypothetical protein